MKTTYSIGTISNGSEYIFTGLGTYRSLKAARAKALSEPRNGLVVIWKEVDVGWGIFRTLAETVQS